MPVIGSSAYPGAASLESPVNDAADVAAALRRIGFDGVDGKDLSRVDFARRPPCFGRRRCGTGRSVTNHSSNRPGFRLTIRYLLRATRSHTASAEKSTR
jgi:hypothetical protein